MSIQVDPDDVHTYVARGRSFGFLYIQGIIDGAELAIQDFNMAIQLAPDYAGSYYWRPAIYALLGEYSRAIEDYTMAIQLERDNAGFYNDRGNTYGNLGQTANYEEDKAKACPLNSNYCW